MEIIYHNHVNMENSWEYFDDIATYYIKIGHFEKIKEVTSLLTIKIETKDMFRYKNNIISFEEKYRDC